MTPHNIDRAEWERRFYERIKTAAFGPDDAPLDAEFAKEVGDAEIESWSTDDGDWLTTLPEEAADEQMSNWEDDGP